MILHEDQLDHGQQVVGGIRSEPFKTPGKLDLRRLLHSTRSYFFNPVELFLIVVITLGILLVGCGAKRSFRIGFIATLSGRVAYMGIAGRDAVQLAVDQCNDTGGIHGRRVELIIKDDQQRDDVAVKVVQALTNADVDAIIGPMTSNTAMAITPI